MQRTAHRALPVLLLAGAACAGDPAGPVPDRLVGRWEAAPFCWEADVPPPCWFRIQAVADPSMAVDLTDRASADLRLDIERAGTFRFRLSAIGVEAFDDHGQLTVQDGMLIMASAAGVDTLDYALEAGFLAVTFREELAFDFDGDGTDDPASAAARLQHIQ